MFNLRNSWITIDRDIFVKMYCYIFQTNLIHIFQKFRYALYKYQFELKDELLANDAVGNAEKYFGPYICYSTWNLLTHAVTNALLLVGSRISICDKMGSLFLSSVAFSHGIEVFLGYWGIFMIDINLVADENYLKIIPVNCYLNHIGYRAYW